MGCWVLLSAVVGSLEDFLRENWLLYGLLRRLLWRRCRAAEATSVVSCERVLKSVAALQQADYYLPTACCLTYDLC